MNIKMNREARYDIVYAQPKYDERLTRLEQREAFKEGVQAGRCQNCLNTLLCISFWSILLRR